MPQYVLAYIGGKPPATPEEGKRHFAEYTQWLASLGSAIVSPANPLKNAHVVAPNGDISAGGKTGMNGYTIVQTDSMQSALKIAQACPFLRIGGALEVAELAPMPDGGGGESGGSGRGAA